MRLIPINSNTWRIVLLGLCALAVLMMPAVPVHAAENAPAPNDNARQQFLSGVFGENMPQAQTLWLTTDVKKDIKKILKHDYAGLRVRYWQTGKAQAETATVRRVWILDEIGKYKPITVGISVKDGAIEKLQVLEYRESHGWEVKHDFFTKQFIGATLPKHWKLDRKIDGISGATLSVRALKKLAMLSLYLDGIMAQKAKP